MKWISLSLMLTIHVYSVHAQITKRNLMIGGNVSASFNTATNETYASNSVANNFSIKPSLGFLLSNRTSLGISLGYTHDMTNFQYYLDPPNKYGSSSSNFYSMGSFIRNYFPITSSIFLVIHSELSYGLGHANTENYYTIPNTSIIVTSDTDWSTVSISSRPVIIFFPSNHWGIEAGVGLINYSYSVFRSNDYQKQTSKNFQVSPASLTFGVAYYLKR